MATDKDVKKNAHHSVSKALGTRKRLRCPECDSEKYYLNRVFDQESEIYSDGYEEKDGYVFNHSHFYCYDCGINSEYDDRF